MKVCSPLLERQLPLLGLNFIYLLDSNMLSSRAKITSNDFGPVVNIVTWILAVSMALSVCAKVAIKIIACHTFNIDDTVLIVAMVKPHTYLLLSFTDIEHVLGHQCCTINLFLYTDIERSWTALDFSYSSTHNTLSEGSCLERLL